MKGKSARFKNFDFDALELWNARPSVHYFQYKSFNAYPMGRMEKMEDYLVQINFCILLRTTRILSSFFLKKNPTENETSAKVPPWRGLNFNLDLVEICKLFCSPSHPCNKKDN